MDHDIPKAAVHVVLRLSLYMAVTGGNDWSMYYDTVARC